MYPTCEAAATYSLTSSAAARLHDSQESEIANIFPWRLFEAQRGGKPHQPVAFIEQDTKSLFASQSCLLLSILQYLDCLITFFFFCWWPRVLRIKHSLFKSRARIQITRKYPLSSSGFSDFRLSYLQPLALVAPLPRTKKSVKKCIINATRSERSDSTHHNLDYLYITGLEGTEWQHSLKDNRLFRCLKLNSNKLPVRKQAQQVRMSYLDGRWSVKRHTAVSSGIP